MTDLSVSNEAFVDMIAGMPIYPNAIIVNSASLRALKKAFTRCLGVESDGLSAGGLLLIGSDEVEAESCRPAHIGNGNEVKSEAY